MKAALNLLLILTVAVLFSGCGGDEKKDDHDHKHDHGHDHDDHEEIGGGGFHKIMLKDADFNVKWVHAGDLLTFTVTDNKFEKDHPIKTDKLLVTNKAGDKFEIPAHGAKDGAGAEFEIKSEKLMHSITGSKLTVKVGDKTYEATIEHVH